MNPGIRVWLVHAEQGRVHLLSGSLFHVDQNEQQLVRQARQGAVPILTIVALGAWFPIERVSLDIFLKLNSKVWQESLEFFNDIPCQGQELAWILG